MAFDDKFVHYTESDECCDIIWSVFSVNPFGILSVDGLFQILTPEHDSFLKLYSLLGLISEKSEHFFQKLLKVFE